MDLTGRVAVVTGSSRGLGFLLARDLLREGPGPVGAPPGVRSAEPSPARTEGPTG